MVIQQLLLKPKIYPYYEYTSTFKDGSVSPGARGEDENENERIWFSKDGLVEKGRLNSGKDELVQNGRTGSELVEQERIGW